MGVHAASAALFNTSSYQREVGALFDYHPTLQEAVRSHRSRRSL